MSTKQLRFLENEVNDLALSLEAEFPELFWTSQAANQLTKVENNSNLAHWQSFPVYDNYFDYFYDFFISRNPPKENSSYIPKLSKQIKKSITKQLAFNSSLLSVKHHYHTFKKPHTWSLTKWRRDLRKYLRSFFQANPHLAHHKLLILREFHECFVKCHQITVWNKKSKEWETFHKRNNFCSCQDSAGNPYNHLCKKDIHKTMITSTDLDFSSWSPSNSHSNYYYFKEIIDPNEICYSEAGGEDTGVFHPITKEPVDQMTLTLSYANKDAEGRFKDPELYQRHHDNPHSEYFDLFDYQQDLKRRIQKKTSREKKKTVPFEKIINSYLSKDKKYISFYDQINYLKKKILKSRGEKAKQLRQKKDQIIFAFTKLKEQLLKELRIPET